MGPDKYALIYKNLTPTLTAGILLDRIRRSRLQLECSSNRCDKLEKPRVGICFYLFSGNNLSVCWI